MRTKKCFALLGYMIFMCSIAMVLSSSYTLADNDTVVDKVNVTVQESCTLGGLGMDSHNAELHNNEYSADTGSTYENGIGKTTMTVFCNDYNGFSIYAVGFTGDSDSSANHTKLVGTTDNTNTISTAVHASSDTTSSWAMKITKVTDGTVAYNPINMSIQNSFDSWHAVPETYTKVAQYHANSGSSVTDTALGGKIESTYAVYVSASQIADTYEGQVKYVLVHPYDGDSPIFPQATESGCVRYYPNGNNVEGTMGCETIYEVADRVTLLASNYSREGYGFAGWSNKYDYATNPNQEGIKFYGPQETIFFTAGQYSDPNPGLSLYAVWVKSVGSIQDTSKVTTVCNDLTQASTDGTANLTSVSAFTDQRDNNTYAIAKLADGNCWMIENLRLDNTNSDNTTGALAQGYGTSTTYGDFSGLANPEKNTFTFYNTANSLYYSGERVGDATIDIGTGDYPEYRMPRYNNLNTPDDVNNRPQYPTSNVFDHDDTTVGMYSYGNYYTWHAAIADTTYYSSGNYDTTSLCPMGWRLPIGNISTVNYSFGKLSVSLGGPEGGANATFSSNPTGAVMSNRLKSYPNNFLYSGYYYGQTTRERGSHGYYWSATACENNSSCNLHLYDSRMYPGTAYEYMYQGLSIRCIALRGT